MSALKVVILDASILQQERLNILCFGVKYSTFSSIEVAIVVEWILLEVLFWYITVSFFLEIVNFVRKWSKYCI